MDIDNKMDSEEKFILWETILIIIGILGLISIITAGCYYYREMKYENFQTTIKDLSDEQKCLHICGFEFDGYLETYKFCAEKCDRISERLNSKI
jgi:uncharacterized protein YxeA